MTIYYQDDAVTLLLGDAATVCATLEPQSIQTVVTSPPYGQQRDYRDGAKEKCSDWDKLMRGVFGVLPMSESGQVLVNLGLILNPQHNFSKIVRELSWLSGRPLMGTFP